MTGESGVRLVGWKRIAAHLACSERTARRWEAEEGLPVHRQVHEAKSTVFAFPAELDHWISSRATAPIETGTKATEAAHSGRGIKIALWVAGVVILVLVALNVNGYLALQSQKPEPDTPSESVMTENVQALDLYNRGMALWAQRGEDANRRAILLLTQATELDENFAEAWAGLASAMATYPTYSEEVNLEEQLDAALLAADRALRLKPELAQPRTLMAEIAERRGEWMRSRQIYDEALSLEPDNPTIIIWTAGHYREAGYMTEAIRLTKRALEVEPNAPPAMNEMAMNMTFYIDEDEGRRQLEYLWNEMGLDTPIIWFGRWMVLLWQGEFDELKAWQAECPLLRGCDQFDLAREAYRSGDEAQIEAFIADVVKAYEDGLPAQIAISVIQETGDTDTMLDIAEAESRKGRFMNAVIFYDPRNSAFRADPRFADIVETLGLLDYWKQSGPPDFCADEPEIPVCRKLN